jgi:two-component system, NtrC family, response regulator AtoC
MTSKPSLLIVDDEVNVTRTLQMVFEQEGYHVLPAYSAAEAIQILQNGHAFQAVITDLNMERADIGLEVARAASRLRPKPLVVICTGFASVTNAQQAMQIHVDYLATKPVDLDELKMVLDRLMRRKLAQGKRK